MSFQKKIKTKSGTYVIEVQGYRKDGKVKHKYLRYLGKLDEQGNLIPSMKIENVEVERVRLYGPVHALHKVTEEVGLEGILGEYAPEILTLVYSHILRPESLNSVKRSINWIDTDEIGLELPVSRKRFEHAMDVLTSEILHVERTLYEKIQVTCDVGSVFYDITDIYFYGKSAMAKQGYSAQKRQSPQIGIGLAVESRYGIPLFHHVFDGNVYDSRTFPVILGRLQEMGRNTCTLVFDRGVSSKKENITDAVKAGFSVIACIPLKGERLKSLALEESQKMGPENICSLSSVFIHARELREEWNGIPVRMIVCLNKPLQQEVQQNRYFELTEALEKLKAGTKIKDGLKKYIKMDGTPQIDHDMVAESEKYDGLYVIITTQETLTTEEVVQKYFEKDLIEKAFRSLKDILSLQPVRHWLTRRIRAHIFICYLSYFHLSWMGMLLKAQGISTSPVKVLQELETIYSVELTDTKTHMSTTRTVPLTKEQEAIYRALRLLS